MSSTGKQRRSASGKANKVGLAHTVKTMKPQCFVEQGRACTFLALAQHGFGKKTCADSVRTAFEHHKR